MMDSYPKVCPYMSFLNALAILELFLVFYQYFQGFWVSLQSRLFFLTNLLWMLEYTGSQLKVLSGKM